LLNKYTFYRHWGLAPQSPLSESQIKPIKRFHRLFFRHCEPHFLPSLRAFEKCVAIYFIYCGLLHCVRKDEIIRSNDGRKIIRAICVIRKNPWFRQKRNKKRAYAIRPYKKTVQS